MHGRGFAPSFVRGLIAAAAIALAAFASLSLIGVFDEETAFGFMIAAFLGGMVFLSIGSSVMGGLVGLVAGRGSGSPVVGAGAGAAASVSGYILFIVALVGGMTVLAAVEGGSEDGQVIDDGEETPVAWGDVGKLLLFCIPAAISGAGLGAAAGFDVGPPARPLAQAQVRMHNTPAAAVDDPASAGATGPTPPGRTSRSSKCPRCATIVTVAAGQRPVCTNCGFGS